MHKNKEEEKEKKSLTPREALINLTRILPVTQANTVIEKICPFFIYKEDMKHIYKNFPTKSIINTNDPLGPFIESEYNKDKNSYRSPWSNTYFPKIETNNFLPNELRLLEEKINMLIKLYLKIYYNPNTISSSYIFLTSSSFSHGFNCCVMIESKFNNHEELDENSFLDSTNIINVKFMKERDREESKAVYTTNTTFLFKLKMKNSECEFNGTENCENKKTAYISENNKVNTHLENIGRSIEENETKLRLKLDKIYLEKNKYILNEIRVSDDEIKNRVNNLKNMFTELEKDAVRRMKERIEEKKNDE